MNNQKPNSEIVIPKSDNPPIPLDEPKIADESPVPFYLGTNDNAKIEILQGMDASLIAKINVLGENKIYTSNLTKKTIKFADSYREVYASADNEKVKIEIQFIEAACVGESDRQFSTKALVNIGENSFEVCGDYYTALQMELDGKYFLENINGNQVDDFENNEILIDLFRSSIGAKLGCNAIGGSLVFDKEKKVKFSNLFATRMYCEGKMQWEENFIKFAPEARSYSNSDYGITFFDEKGKKIMLLKRK